MTNLQLYRRVLAFAKPFKGTIRSIFLCILLISLIDALGTWFLSSVFDIIQSHSGEGAYLGTCLGFVALSAGAVLARILISRYQGNLEIRELDIKASNHLNHFSISKYFGFSNGQHINEHSGVKQSIITSGFQSVQSQIQMFVYVLFPALTSFVVSMGMLFWINLYLGVGAFLVSVAFIFAVWRFNLFLGPRLRGVRDARNQTARTISELYRFVSLIKNEGGEAKSLVELDKVQEEHQQSYEGTWIRGNNLLTLIRVATALFRYGALLFAVALLFRGQIGAGAIFLVFTWSQNFVQSLWTITDMQKQFMTDKMNIEKYFQLLEIKSDITQIDQPQLPAAGGEIEFQSVSFGYPQRKKTHGDHQPSTGGEMVLDSLSFSIKGGEKVAFVGESGSGKSTIANLIRRAFDPQSGQILVNGHCLKELDLGAFLKTIGSVDQQVNLFDRSIRDNIMYGTAEVLTEEQIKNIARLCSIDGFYAKLEHGLDTLVGEGGSKLSGGEKQRIGIARALAKTPQILIFDEATSALDTISERLVQKSIDLVSVGKTCIIIAHRLSTVKGCDKIFVLKGGKLVGQGSHLELLRDCPYYLQLVQHQLTAAPSE